MGIPESNGLFNVYTGKPVKEEGFNCTRLTVFLARDEIKDWDKWHDAHLQAASGICLYKDKCDLYEQTLRKQLNKGMQLQLDFKDN